MRILQLIAMLKSLMGMIGISLPALMELIQKIMSIGLPPDVRSEVAFREWLAKLGQVAVEISALTPIVLDDVFAKFLLSTTSNDEAWKTFYTIISLFFPEGALTASPPVDAAIYTDATKLCSQIDGEKLGFNPVMILSFIKLIVDIISAWKK
jgi:predicted membrane protein